MKLIKKYNFADIEIYMNVGGKEYINISNYSICSKENERIKFNEDFKFLLTFTFCMYVKQAKKYVCELTLEELTELAGMTKKKNMFEDNEDIFALFCAREIANYNYGKINLKEGSEHTYGFARQVYKEYDEKNKKRVRTYPVIFEKTFQETTLM